MVCWDLNHGLARFWKIAHHLMTEFLTFIRLEDIAIPCERIDEAVSEQGRKNFVDNSFVYCEFCCLLAGRQRRRRRSCGTSSSCWNARNNQLRGMFVKRRNIFKKKSKRARVGDETMSNETADVFCGATMMMMMKVIFFLVASAFLFLLLQLLLFR